MTSISDRDYLLFILKNNCTLQPELKLFPRAALDLWWAGGRGAGGTRVCGVTVGVV